MDIDPTHDLEGIFTLNASATDPISDEQKRTIRDHVHRALERGNATPEQRERTKVKLDAFLEQVGTNPVFHASARALAEDFRMMAVKLEALRHGILAIAFAFHASGQTQHAVQVGEVMGFAYAASSLLEMAESSLLHSIECESCAKDGHASESETIPPPAPGPEEAA